MRGLAFYDPDRICVFVFGNYILYCLVVCLIESTMKR